MSTRIKLRVQGLTNSQIQSGAYALILAEERGLRGMPIIVGTAEAQSIAIALEQITPPRPLTHDLFASFTHAFGIHLREVFIYKFEDGVFYSELLFDNGTQQVRLDSRTSDAIAIALRVGCGIFTTEQILQECGVILEDVSPTDEELDRNEDEVFNFLQELDPKEMTEDELDMWLSYLEIEELEEKLNEAISNENYETAKIYKDALRRREEGDDEDEEEEESSE